MSAQPTWSTITRRGFMSHLTAFGLVAGVTPLTEVLAQERPVSGGILRTTLYAEPNSLDPHRPITTIEFTMRGAFFNGLVEETPALALKPALAESWEVSPDAKTYTFRLRNGVKFHDGSEMTSETVQTSLRRAADPAVSPAAAIKAIADRVATMSAPDRHTVRIELKAPSGSFLPDLSEVMIVPASFDPARPVGTGPFQFVEWVRNQRIRVKKFPDYFKKGLPYLDEVVYMTTPDEDQRLSLLRTGQVDFVDSVSLARVKNLEKEGKFPVISVTPGQRTAAYIMRINCSRSPLNNVKVRQALSYAIDRQAVLDVNFGYGGIRSNFMPSKHWAFNSQARSYDQRDVARAKRLLADAGLPSGFPVELTHHTVSETYKSIAQVIQANLSDIGVKVSLMQLELGVWVDKVLRKRDFQLALSGNSVRSDPDAVYSDMYDQTRVNGGAIQWQNEEAQKLLGEGRTQANVEQRKKVYARFQEIVQEESPIIVIDEIPAVHAAAPAVRGFEADNRSLTFFEKVWLKK
jgi:peptide/nickel transport system substrate-binding protein